METGDRNICDPETLCFHELPSLSPLLIEIKLSIRWIGKILKPKIILSFFGFFNQNEIVILAFFFEKKN